MSTILDHKLLEWLIMSSKISQVLKRLMFEQQIRTTELARRIGLKQPTVHRIVEGISRNPHVSSLKPLAQFFKLTVEQLRGIDPLPWPHIQNALTLAPTSAVPVLGWQEAVNWPDESLESEDCNSANPVVMPDRELGENAFALIVNDSSMSPQFPVGTQLILDPCKEAKERGFVIVALKGHPKAVFRQLLSDGRQHYLKALNPDLDDVKMILLQDDDRICGTLVQARLDYDSTY